MTSATQITFLGQTSTMIKQGEHSLVIDPHFGRRALWYKHNRPPVFDPFQLHNVDAVLISQPSFGRFHPASLKYFKQRKTRIYSDSGVARWIRRFYGFDVTLLEPGKVFAVGEWRVRVLATPRINLRAGVLHQNAFHFLIETPNARVFAGSEFQFPDDFSLRLAGSERLNAAILPLDDFRFFPSRPQSPEKFINSFAMTQAEYWLPNALDGFSCKGGTPGVAFQEFKKYLEMHANLQEKIRILNPGESWEHAC